MRSINLTFLVIIITFFSLGFAPLHTIYHLEGYPTAEMRAEWPVGLADLANFRGRVLAYLCNSKDVFYFKGDTDAFNEFLKRSEDIRDVRIILVRNSGAPVNIKTSRGSSGPYDWKVNVYSTRYDRGEFVTPAKDGSPHQVIEIHTWADGKISFEELLFSDRVEFQEKIHAK